jgi:hypothetical protein
MKYMAEGADSRKFTLVQSAEQMVWAMHRPQFITDVFDDAFKQIPDTTGLGEIFLVVNLGKLEKKRRRLVGYRP